MTSPIISDFSNGALGTYTAVVTTSNAVTAVTATTCNTITNAPIAGLLATNDTVYLPLVLKPPKVTHKHAQALQRVRPGHKLTSRA